MDFPGKETVSLIYFLLPGFVASWVFLGLTTHPRRDAFDRTVQALIFTSMVKVLAYGVRKLWWAWWHSSHPEGHWTESHDLVVGVALALVVGFGLAAAADNDLPHRWLRKIKVTKRSSFASEWYSTFHRLPRFVILTFKDGRRLRGWVNEFPNDPVTGHFHMEKVEWVAADGTCTPLAQLKGMLFPSAEVQMVEMLCNDNELPDTLGRIIDQQAELAKQHGKITNGEEQSKQCTGDEGPQRAAAVSTD